MNSSLKTVLSRSLRVTSSSAPSRGQKLVEASVNRSGPSSRSFARLYSTTAPLQASFNTYFSTQATNSSLKQHAGRILSARNSRAISGSSSLSRQSRRSMFIRTEPTPNPDSMKFMPDKQLLEPGQSIDFDNAMSAARSPLAKMLFRNDAVQRVFIGSSFVTITKDEEVEWDEIKPIVFADLMEFFSSGEEVLLGEVPESDTTILPDDSEDVALIKTLIETRIRPSIQDDGGDLTYRGFIDGVVFLQLQGSCTSCPSSSVTLKNGIEKMLKHWSSSVISVIAVESEEEWERIANGGNPVSKSETKTDASTASTSNASSSSSSSQSAADSHQLADLNSQKSSNAPKTDDL